MLKEKILDEHIINIIQSNEIAEQSELQEILKQRGYEIPQATLSRRLKKLHIIKIQGIYKPFQVQQSHLPTILNMQISEYGIIVLHTNPGQASSLAYFLDKKYVSYSSDETKKSGILGTIAGDDTIILILKSSSFFDHAYKLLLEDFPYLSDMNKEINNF